MKKYEMRRKIAFILALFTLSLSAQNKIRTLEELIDKSDPAWKIVEEQIKNAKNRVEVLPVDTIKAKDALTKIQVTTHSIMGSIVYMTGGILIDNGWIRILGSGSEKLTRSLPNWNKGKGFDDYGQQSRFLLIADDAIGGFFLLNGGGLGTDIGKVYYLSPDKLEYEPLEITYSEFINFCFNNNLDKFYKNLRWKNWEKDIDKLNGDEVFSFYPYLWSKEGKNINKTEKNKVPIEEQYYFNLEFRKQLGLEN